MITSAVTAEEHEVYVGDPVLYNGKLYQVESFQDNDRERAVLVSVSCDNLVHKCKGIRVQNLQMVPCTFQGGSLVSPSIKVWNQILLLYLATSGDRITYTPGMLSEAVTYIDKMLCKNYFQDPEDSWEDTDFLDMIEHSRPVVIATLFDQAPDEARKLSDVIDDAISATLRRIRKSHIH